MKHKYIIDDFTAVTKIPKLEKLVAERYEEAEKELDKLDSYYALKAKKLAENLGNDFARIAESQEVKDMVYEHNQLRTKIISVMLAMKCFQLSQAGQKPAQQRPSPTGTL